MDEPPRSQHPTAEQAGSEHGRKTGTNRAHKNDLGLVKPEVKNGCAARDLNPEPAD